MCILCFASITSSTSVELSTEVLEVSTETHLSGEPPSPILPTSLCNSLVVTPHTSVDSTSVDPTSLNPTIVLTSDNSCVFPPRVFLVLCFNRDVLKGRPFEMPEFHSDGFFYGLDVPSGGTWLSVAPNGGFVAILDHDELKEDAISKGGPGLPRGLLALQRQTEEPRASVSEWWRYAGYNLVQGNLFSDISSWIVHTNRPKPNSTELLFPIKNFDVSGNAFALANGSIARGPDHGGPKVAFAKRAAHQALIKKYEDNLSTEDLAVCVCDELSKLMARDEPFSDLPPLEQFKPGLYQSDVEYSRCQSPFVTKLDSWATVSQQVIVGVDKQIFHFCRRISGAGLGDWKIAKLPVSP